MASEACSSVAAANTSVMAVTGKRGQEADTQTGARKLVKSDHPEGEQVIRFYTGKKGGVAYKYNNNPLIPKSEINDYEWLSNFYPSSLCSDGTVYKSSEHYFQARRFERVPSMEDMRATKCAPVDQHTDEMRALRLEFVKHIVDAPTPNTAFYLNSYVSFRKSDGGFYVKAPYPHMKPHAELIRRFYDKGLRSFPPNSDGDVEIMMVALRLKFGQSDELRSKLLATGQATLIEHTRRDCVWGDGGDGSGRNQLGKCLMRVRSEIVGS